MKGAAGFIGLRLIDPIEVYYIPSQNTFYPIISKSGCSSIKVMLIRKFKPDYENTFPGIHHVNPADITKGEVQRLYFNTKDSYAKWTKGKQMVFVMREPYSRFYSCYLDVSSGKNIMYQHPSGLDWFYDFKKDISLNEFLKKVCALSDKFSDRHFRSQAFYLSDNVKKGLASLQAFTLKEYMSGNATNAASEENKPLQLNQNKTSISDDEREKLKTNSAFNKRFKTDLLLFDSIKNKSI